MRFKKNKSPQKALEPSIYSALLTSASISPKTLTLMAKKQQPPPPAPPSSSSEEEEESSSDDDEETITTKSPNPQAPTKNQHQEEETDEESESGSSDDEDDDEEDEEPLPDTNGPRSISTAAPPALKPSDAGEKPNGKGNANGKALFQRIWSLEDEIAILEAMAEFEPKHGPIKLNAAGIRGFHEFVKGSLSLEVSGSQLLEKIKRLKKKYESVAARVKNGKAVKFGKPHVGKVYEISKKVWGIGNDNEVKEVKVVESKNAANDVGGSLKREYPFMKDAMSNVRCGISAELLQTLDPEKVRPLEKEFKKQKVLEIKNKIRGIELMNQALQWVLEDIENMAD